MIIIKATTPEKEAQFVAKIEAALSGEDMELFTDDEQELSMDQILLLMTTNVVRSRQYIGRLVGQVQKQQEATRKQNELLTPIAEYFAYLLEDVMPSERAFSLPERLEQQRQIAKRLRENGFIGARAQNKGVEGQ